MQMKKYKWKGLYIRQEYPKTILNILTLKHAHIQSLGPVTSQKSEDPKDRHPKIPKAQKSEGP